MQGNDIFDGKTRSIVVVGDRGTVGACDDNVEICYGSFSVDIRGEAIELMPKSVISITQNSSTKLTVKASS